MPLGSRPTPHALLCQIAALSVSSARHNQRISQHSPCTLLILHLLMCTHKCNMLVVRKLSLVQVFNSRMDFICSNFKNISYTNKIKKHKQVTWLISNQIMLSSDGTIITILLIFCDATIHIVIFKTKFGCFWFLFREHLRAKALILKGLGE